MILFRAVLAAAVVSCLFPADARAERRCGGEIDYDDWACRYVPRSGWRWELVYVGTRFEPCTGGSILFGRATQCARPALTETCGGGDTCEQEADEQEPVPCDLPRPDGECTGPIPPPDREGWALHDGTPGDYTPDPRFSYNSTGHANQISNPTVGRFVVQFPGLGGEDGNVQVVAYGPGNDRCHVERWSGLPDLRVFVRCYSPAGLFANSPFLVYFSATDDTVTGTREIGYARHDLPPAEPEDYEPAAPAFQWNSNGPRPVTTKLETGRYAVRFRNLLHSNGAPIVTALGPGPLFCQVSSTGLYTAGADTGTQVSVLCFDTDGRPADSGFTLRYEWQRSVPGALALEGYAFAHLAVTPAYTPNPQFNSTGQVNSAQRPAPATYVVTYPGLPAPEPGPDPRPEVRASTVLLSARTGDASYCKVVSWDGSNSQTRVNVGCFDYTGATADRTHQEVYLTRRPAEPPTNP